MEGIFACVGHPELTHQAWLPVVAICSHHRIPQPSQWNLLCCANSKPSPPFRSGISSFLLWCLILGELPSLTAVWDTSLHSPSASTFYLRTSVRSPSLRENRYMAHFSLWNFEYINLWRRKNILLPHILLAKDQQDMWKKGRKKRKRRNYVRGRDREWRKGKKEGKEGKLQLYPDSNIYKAQAIEDLDIWTTFLAQLSKICLSSILLLVLLLLFFSHIVLQTPFIHFNPIL